MSPRVQFGIAIPQTFIQGPVRTDLIRDVILLAEERGFHSLWVQDEVLDAPPTLDPVELLTYASALTHRVRLGTAVLVTPTRSPVHLAKSLATLDQLSHGRLIVGVGLGGDTGHYPAYGISAAHRTARFTASIELMRRLWAQPLVTFESPFWNLERVSLDPKPVQKPHPPVWIGGRHPAALRRAAALGDGFIGAGASSLTEFAEAVRIVHDGLADSGRDPAHFTVSKRVYVAVHSDRAQAGRRLEEWFSRFYRTTGLAEKVAVWGEPEECIARLSEVAASGAHLIILNPVFDEREQVERLATEVVPRVQTRVAP
jgi:probable F420-dependent oxidoreductase